MRRLSTGADFHGVFHAEIYVSDLFAAALRSLAAKPLSYFFVTDNSAERTCAGCVVGGGGMHSTYMCICTAVEPV